MNKFDVVFLIATQDTHNIIYYKNPHLIAHNSQLSFTTAVVMHNPTEYE